MPAMSRIESAFCRSAPWRTFARRLVLPWSMQGFRPQGHLLEIGAGSGAMAAEVLALHPDITMTVTDFDQAMVDGATERLRTFGDRVTLREADATGLPFDDGAFDAVLSWIMLHHTIEWEKAIAEAVRVVRPGGHVVGYDIVSTPLSRLLRRDEGPGFRRLRPGELRDAVGGLPVAQAILTPSLAGLAVRFVLRKTDAA